MEGIGSEVSQKIRAAIKAKLIELGAYVDEELPDYIMVMVANKRTRNQMDDDLKLFLNNNTKEFTSWLHTVLQKLHEVTIGGLDSNKSSKKNATLTEDTSVKNHKSEKKHRKEKKMKKEKIKDKHKNKTDKKKHKDKTKEKSRKLSAVSEDNGDVADSSLVNKTEHENESKISDINTVVGDVILGRLQENNKNVSTSEQIVVTEEKEQNGTIEDGVLNKKNDWSSDEEILELKAEKEMKEVNDSLNIKPAEVVIEEKVRVRDDEEVVTNKQETETANTEEKRESRSRSRSLSPEELRRQLLISRAKRKWEQSRKTKRMESKSPEIEIIDQSSDKSQSVSRRVVTDRSSLTATEDDKSNIGVRRSESRSPRPTSQQTQSTTTTTRNQSSRQITIVRENVKVIKDKHGNTVSIVTSKNERRKVCLLPDNKRSLSESSSSSSSCSRNVSPIVNVNLLEGKNRKNRHIESDSDDDSLTMSDEKSRRKKKKNLSSRIYSVPEPDNPDIPSVVKVKPREFTAKDKQANKNLILKAVAAAEKSVAKVAVTRKEAETDVKKPPDALFTKDLRGKRYEKLAVTLPNIKSSDDEKQVSGTKNKRRVSISTNSDSIEMKADSVADSDVSRGVFITFRKTRKDNDDQFISSKTTVMEKNDKFIHNWLEGVEKAVKEDEIVNPDDLVDVYNVEDKEEPSGDLENGEDGEAGTDNDKVGRKKLTTKKKKSSEDDPKSKKMKLTERDIENIRLIPNRPFTDDGPQIVVTLDGLKSTVIKELIAKNKEGAGGPATTPTVEKAEVEGERMTDRFARLTKEPVAVESKNKKLIAQLSEKFGKVDREFDDKRRKLEDVKRRRRRSSREDDRGKKPPPLPPSHHSVTVKKSPRDAMLDLEYEDLRRMRSKERCKFWPDCSKGNNCEYHHPTSPCKLLPNCKFKENCMYIHPRCEDDLNCINRDCPYEHTSDQSKRKKQKLGIQERTGNRDRRNTSRPYSSSGSTYRHRASSSDTPRSYYNVKQCRYDVDCINPDCTFLHSDQSRRTRRSKWKKT